MDRNKINELIETAEKARQSHTRLIRDSLSELRFFVMTGAFMRA